MQENEFIVISRGLKTLVLEHVTHNGISSFSLIIAVDEWSDAAMNILINAACKFDNKPKQHSHRKLVS